MGPASGRRWAPALYSLEALLGCPAVRGVVDGALQVNAAKLPDCAAKGDTGGAPPARLAGRSYPHALRRQLLGNRRYGAGGRCELGGAATAHGTGRRAARAVGGPLALTAAARASRMALDSSSSSSARSDVCASTPRTARSCGRGLAVRVALCIGAPTAFRTTPRAEADTQAALRVARRGRQQRRRRRRAGEGRACCSSTELRWCSVSVSAVVGGRNSAAAGRRVRECNAGEQSDRGAPFPEGDDI